MTSSAKTITVFGSTGNQGGSVARSLAKNKTFHVRGITRNPKSEKARELSDLGVEIVQADGWNKEQMLNAFKGSWGAFVNTNTEDPSCNQPGGPTETDLGKLIVDAAIEAGVKHFVYSSFADSMALTNGTVYCRMMMHKAGILEYARSKRSKDFSVISVDAGWYFEGLLVPEYAAAMGGFPFNADEEGYLTLKVPKWGKDNAFIAIAEDYGDIVHGVFLNPEKWDGKRIQGVSEIIDWDGIVQAFENAVPGKKARFVPLASWDDFETYGTRELEDLKQLFHFAHVTGGRAFADGATENETAKTLKREAVAAQGDIDNHEMMTAEKYFRKHFKEVS